MWVWIKQSCIHYSLLLVQQTVWTILYYKCIYYCVFFLNFYFRSCNKNYQKTGTKSKNIKFNWQFYLYITKSKMRLWKTIKHQLWPLPLPKINAINHKFGKNKTSHYIWWNGWMGGGWEIVNNKNINVETIFFLSIGFPPEWTMQSYNFLVGDFKREFSDTFYISAFFIIILFSIFYVASGRIVYIFVFLNCSWANLELNR